MRAPVAPTRLRRRVARLAAGALMCSVAVGSAVADDTGGFDSLVPAGQPVPEIALTTLDGQEVSLSGLRGRVVLLLFGELYNENSVKAAGDISTVLESPTFVGSQPVAYLVITQQAASSDLLAEARRKGLRIPILHDSGRTAFASYRVRVLPSLVVIDGSGTAVLPCVGYPLDFEDMVVDSLLYASGSLSRQEFDQRRSAAPQDRLPEEQVRARRMAALGDLLAERGSIEMAISTYRNAIALHADCVPARIGLGGCLLSRGELVEAEGHFLHVLGSEPDSVAAALGLIRIQTRRGGEELKRAADGARELLRRRPNDPTVVYTAGVVAEASGDANAALGHYRKAAELLLFGNDR